MQTQRIVLTSFIVPLFGLLYGCQPGESRQQPKAPVVAVPIAIQASADNSANPVVSREEFTALAKDIGCFACHSIEKKLLGPAWKDVAAVYRKDASAEDKIMNKITNGGSGVWGKIAMPGYPDLGDEKKRILTRYILSLK
ncbi:MAG: cytochrome C [Sulfuricella denitrificans]|nr:cytochrome C [Sulfuricella denitrificans]